MSDKNQPSNQTDPDHFPTANVTQASSFANWLQESTLLLWLAVAACLCIAIGLTYRSLSPAGQQVVVRFQNGYGLKVEDQVRYRGIVVGEVEEVGLGEQLHGINVKLRLAPAAAALARTGTQFWIERPKISLGAVRGLDTIVGGRYVSVLPGPDDATLVTEFEGIEEPPPIVDVGDGGLLISLVAENRFGLERGAPLTYRGFHVGQVLATSLSEDAMSIEVQAVVDRQYRELVRTNSQFWNNGGMDFKIGLRGVDVDVDTLSSLAAGGIAFATPQPAGVPAEPGQVFQLSPEEIEGWQEWAPLLEMGRDAIRDRLENDDPNNPGLLNRIRARITGEPIKPEKESEPEI